LTTLAPDTISLSNDVEFQWVNEVRYLGVFIVHIRLLQCSLDHAKIVSSCSQCDLWGGQLHYN